MPIPQLVMTAVASGPSRELDEYEDAKFELAEPVRISQASSPPSEESLDDFRDFFARLAEDRFNLVVAGRFSRGKTSLMNAILGMGRLPTAIVPLTSVITSVGYGSTERVSLVFKRGGLPSQILMSELPLHITELGNPGNVRGIAQAKIELPAEILRRGFYFIDTPGLGSSIPENTRTSMEFLPEADALVLVSGYESPLSEDEIRVLQAFANSTVQVFVVINKQDTLALEARGEVIEFVARQLERVFGDHPPPVFSTSANDGLAAKLNQDAVRLEASGIPQLERALTQFLIDNKRQHFLLNMYERAGDLIRTHGSGASTTRLTEKIDQLRSKMQGQPLERRLAVKPAETMMAFPGAGIRERGCNVCEQIHGRIFEFLCRYQHELVTDAQQLAQFVAAGGLCARHLWLYASLAAPRDICVSLAPLLMRVSAELRLGRSRPGALNETIVAPPECRLCVIQREIESEALARIGSRSQRCDTSSAADLPPLCIPHLRFFLENLENAELIDELLAGECDVIDRLAEDMRRYAVKVDGLRRALTSEEEREASKDALNCVAGRRLIIR